jgi:hypothetical protein
MLYRCSLPSFIASIEATHTLVYTRGLPSSGFLEGSRVNSNLGVFLVACEFVNRLNVFVYKLAFQYIVDIRSAETD